MLKKTKLLGLMLIALIMSSCGLFSCTPTEVTIEQDDDGEWRIYDAQGNNKGTWRVNEGDEITWNVTGSDMIFSFPTDMETYFEFEEGYFSETDTSYSGNEGNEERRIQEIQEGNSLRLTVKVREIERELAKTESAEADTIDYDIFVIEAQKYVIGNSPPILIIRRSYN